ASDQLVGKSVLTTYTHHEPVHKVAWTKAPHGSGHLLTSISADGKMIAWEPNDLRLPALGFQLRKERARAEGGMMEGGCALGFSPLDPSTFVAGLETGGLHKCSLLANEKRSVGAVLSLRSELPWSKPAAALLTRVAEGEFDRLKRRIEREAVIARAKQVGVEHVFAAAPELNQIYKSPITFGYEERLAPTRLTHPHLASASTSHSGPVYEVAFSPFHRNIFLTASSDASIRPRAVHVIEPCSSTVFAAAWSPCRPLVFAAAAADGNLYIYDLKRSKGWPDVTDNRSPVHAVAFNPRNPELVATADAQGFIKIWQLSHFLSNLAPREQQLLDRMAAIRGEQMDGEEEENDMGTHMDGEDDHEDDPEL
ncbi:MAG: hypothetical protein SGPRY_012218, partial [Prymnesium sp.]